MKKEYWIILIVYIAMQLSSLFGVPLVLFIGGAFGQNPENMQILAVAYWLVFSFTITLIITLLLLRKEMKRGLERDASSAASSVGWAIGGIFLALIAQATAASIENMIGIEMGSENTQQIIRIIEASPIVILISSVVGPILEEIVFRKVIFGSLHKRFNFFVSALISSVIFALAHFEPEHILLYSAMGFTFAFLYVKTKRIIVPIFAHVSMNTLVALIQLNQENLEKWMKEMENIQSFISLIAA
ncbi:CPBP family intramembrane glutamic endopeptidase [Cytobacillus sp. NCCP-133]|uniref:CPBP family intramembrane glutamic endopeptidase n=1 Tax=Cytobacillus sp. NCCP-133 TaxID=766848 RepID=UPI002231B25F|nr:type II CAAX endopeptidase family protein [Cytobacillus sp. NCCP-133]GLB61972.1 peptidase [Cytobacillus sp. NCCP-133]